MAILSCKNCEREFEAPRSDAKWCPTCKPEKNRDRFRRFELAHKVPCSICGALGHRRSTVCATCSTKARGEANSGDKNPSWKGGRTRHTQGYIQVLGKSSRNKSPYQMEHIVVWEAANGPIPDKWQVHHINGIKDDNRLENLVAMSESDHHSSRGLVPYEKRILELEALVTELRTALDSLNLASIAAMTAN